MIAIRGAPVRPCMMRQITTSSRLVETLSSRHEAMKHPMQNRNRRLRPNRAESQAVGGIPIAEATMLPVTTQEIWSMLADRSPCICGRDTRMIVCVLA